MENTKIKKIMVELENGAVLEFNKQALLFVEDEMTETEKKIHADNTKMCVIAGCNAAFMAAATESALNTMATNAPGSEVIPMMKFLEERLGIDGFLEKILG